MPKLKTSGIDHLNLEVADLGETMDFYKALFDFDELEDLASDDGKIIGNERVKLAIYHHEDFGRYKKKGFHHFGLHIENFEAVKARCDELGVEIIYGDAVQWPASKSIYIMDPNGYTIELTEKWGGALA